MEYYVIDAHCDTGSEILDRNEKLYKNSRHLSIDKMSPFKSYVQFYAAWVGKEEKNPLTRALDIIYKTLFLSLLLSIIIRFLRIIVNCTI